MMGPLRVGLTAVTEPALPSAHDPTFNVSAMRNRGFTVSY